MGKLYVVCLFAFSLLLLAGNGMAQNKLQFSVPFKLIDNRPFIEVQINNKTLHFMLDCGASNVIDLNTANSLHLKLSNPSYQTGAGAKRVRSYTTNIDTARIGRSQMINENFGVIDLSEIKNKLHPPYLDGAIGYNFMKDYAVQFDYPKGVINFYATYSGAYPIPFTLYYSQTPLLKVKIDGTEATVIMDTGDRSSLTIFNHYADKTDIKQRYTLSDTTITGHGIGGPIYARTFTLKQLEVGRNKITAIPSRIPMLKTGAFAQTDIDGSIGGGVLKSFKFTINYKTRKLYLE